MKMLTLKMRGRHWRPSGWIASVIEVLNKERPIPSIVLKCHNPSQGVDPVCNGFWHTFLQEMEFTLLATAPPRGSSFSRVSRNMPVIIASRSWTTFAIKLVDLHSESLGLWRSSTNFLREWCRISLPLNYHIIGLILSMVKIGRASCRERVSPYG